MLTGYIDESYTGENAPVTFGLTCVYSTWENWFWIANEWKKVIDAKNLQLVSEGRTKISRFHSKEISNFEDEFEGWTGDERSEFTNLLLFREISGNFVQSYGLTANLKQVAEDWPRVKFDGVRQFGYHIMLRMIMLKLETIIPPYSAQEHESRLFMNAANSTDRRGPM